MLHFTDSNFRLKAIAMKPYQHLSQESRYTLSAELKTGTQLQQIANELGCCRQTLWRERKRSTGLRGYRLRQAHDKAMQRQQETRQQRSANRLSDLGLAYIEHLIIKRSHFKQIPGVLSKFLVP